MSLTKEKRVEKFLAMIGRDNMVKTILENLSAAYSNDVLASLALAMADRVAAARGNDAFMAEQRRGVKGGFGWALEQMRHGKQVRRRRWAQATFISIATAQVQLQRPPMTPIEENEEPRLMNGGFFVMRQWINAGERFVPWHVCDEDLLCEDWTVVEDGWRQGGRT